MNKKTKLIVTSLGIFFSYFYFNILQEKITRGRYGDDRNPDGSVGEKFTFTLTMVGVQCLWNWIFAKELATVKTEKEDKTYFGYYACLAITYLLAMVSSNMALRWVAYPTVVIGKSARPVPVMLLGVLIGRKSYSLQRYNFVLIIVTGTVLFMMKETKIEKIEAPGPMISMGEVLLILSLSMDGLTATIQDRIRAAHSLSAQHMTIAMNAWSTVILLVGVIFTGEIFHFIAFASRYPYVLVQLAMLAITGALGQLFIFIMVASYGPSACSVVTTTRKLFTVLCSVLFFGNPLTPIQWFGAFLVFLGLFADAAFGKSAPKGLENSKKREKLLSNETVKD